MPVSAALSIFFFKGFFKYVNSKRRSKENTGPIFVEDSHLANRDEEKVKTFNALPQSLLILVDLRLPSPLNWRTTSPFVDTEIVKDQLYQLNIHKFMGPDGIHPRVLKELSECCSRTPVNYLSKVLESGEVPTDWKLANVIPIYKKGMREDPGNYRPVSLTSVPGKIMVTIQGTNERLLKNNAIMRHKSTWVHKGKVLFD
ncbi:mitochondrial enolase superfamily member 1 [Grus japonensis]|uniref:Mitochondrial enolase superfamily member 1 n=1 Tax=Grus japonensis TaxID=30415 RepID=A0ABC9W8Z2_GRUJA